MKKRIVAFIAILMIVLTTVITCKKDDFKEVIGTCPTPVKIEYTVQLSSSPVLGGVTLGAGTFPKDTTLSVSATPNTGYTFVNWKEGTTILTTSSNYTFTLDTNKVFIASFAPVIITNLNVVTSSNPLAGGTTLGGGSFAPNTAVTLTATPSAGYTFVNWTQKAAIASTTPSFTFNLVKDSAFVANFSINTYTLNVTAINGTVVKNPNQPTYNYGTSAILTPTPALGYVFDSWSGDATGNANPLTVLMDANKNITANFTLVPTFTLNTAAVNGTVAKNPDQLSYNKNVLVVLTATPALGYQFDSWSGDTTGIVSPITIKMNANKNITANFILTPVTYTLNASGVNGSVLKFADKLAYNLNEVVQLTAVPDAGYKFDSWSGDASGILNPTTVTMTSNKNVTANFSLIIAAVCPTIVDLGLSGNFAIFAESGISTTGVTLITGDIGANPVTSTSITGFGLILPAGSAFSTSSLVVGKIYAPDYAVPTPANMVTTSGNMHTAYTTANGLVVPAPVNEFMAGNLNGQTLTAGIYKWSSGVSITNGIVLDGGGDNCATFIMQIAGNLTVANSAIITLQNGAQAKNIFWVVAGSGAVLGTNVDFSGNILSKTLISVNTGGKVLGRLLAQTAVTLNAATVIKP